MAPRQFRPCCNRASLGVQVQKAFGVAAQAHFGPAPYVLSWPSAASGALPVEGGVAVASAREIAAAPDPAARQKEPKICWRPASRLSRAPKD